MGGLHSSGDGFTIVEGAGIPRLDVVGFNHDVDWPTLVERLAAVGSGDVKPVFDQTCWNYPNRTPRRTRCAAGGVCRSPLYWPSRPAPPQHAIRMERRASG